MNKDFIEIENGTAKKLHGLLEDDTFDLYEFISEKKGDWEGRISKVLNKNTFRAATNGSGIIQVFKGKVVANLNNGEYIFIKKI